MTTTSLKLPEALKQRAVTAAQQQGVSPHAFMLQAIEQAASTAERRASFIAEALAARENLMQGGVAYAADEVHAYLKARIADKQASQPKATSWQD